MALPPEILKKVKLLEISTRKLVNSTFAGQYHSAFRGQGMTFAEFREYVPGDDVRAISWPVTARTGKTFIKKFDEERELIVILAVDISASTNFGSGDHFKGEAITHLSALLGFSAAKNNDHVGLLLFSDQVEHFVPPKKGRGNVQRILRDLYYFKPRSTGTNVDAATTYLQGILKKRSTIFVFSDFLDSTFAQSLKHLSRKHEVVACMIEDPVERNLPNLGLIEVRDPETGEMMLIDSSSKAFREAYSREQKRRNQEREAEFRRSQIDRIDILNDEHFVEPLIEYFRRKSVRK